MTLIEMSSPQKQRGLAALVTAVVILIAITIVIIFSAKFGLQETRISANEARHKEAQQQADAALELAASFLDENRDLLFDGEGAGWVDCTTSTDIQSAFPCTVELDAIGAQQYSKVFGVLDAGPPVIINPASELELGVLQPDGANSDAYILYDESASEPSLIAVGVGQSNDLTAYSAARLEFARVALVTPGEIPPIMAPELNLNGNFTIVANPNNGVGTTGVPISGWTKQETSSGTGSWQTCHLGDFQDNGKVCTDVYTSGDNWSNCGCISSLSNKNDINYDIYEDDGFPDPLAYLFGTSNPAEVKEIIRGAGGKVFEAGEGCTGLASLTFQTSPFVWVEDSCTVPSVGTIEYPVILVVNGKMTINATTDAWGLLVSVSEVQSNGAANIHGSLVADGIADIANGGYRQIYTPEVLDNLKYNDLATVTGKVPYSWTDMIINVPTN
ncbi:MAG: PilX N-terminal domain-containing pilus assembly protein [Pseudomonadota bacterium]|nr:PilX N-terminal domain-containing pilus assembly protein [Pseudomonadota bacterium]